MYVELFCKSNFSFLRGASDSREYVQRAASLKLPAVGIADVNGVYALPRAYEAIRGQDCELKLICGAEVTLGDHPPVNLIATTRAAYGLLCRILTKVHADKEKGEGFITLPELLFLLENFPGRQELICTPQIQDNTNLSLLKELFPHGMYLPLCRYLDGMDRERTRKVLQLSQHFQIPLVATNDVHYHIPQRRPLQDCLTCIREGTTIDKAGFLLFGNEERYLKSAAQMQSLFADLPQALAATLEISEKCQFHLSQLKYSYPHEFIPPGHTAQSYLHQLVHAGAQEVYQGQIPEDVRQQIKRELDFFARRGDEHYFLTVHDIVRFANEKNIICQGRGSAANSVVCYVLGITSVDPVKMGLLFDRFMNDGRPEPPDIDIDFEHERREEVLQYVYKRFGRERAAMVSAVRTYRRKSAFLELSKAVGIEVGTISAGELEQNFTALAKDKIDRKIFVDELSAELKGFPRHLSIHSGGFVLSNDPLIEMVPVEPARMPGRTIVQWDKNDLETLGLMKVDLLSIGFLAVLHKATDLAGISWRTIPMDDEPTYEMIRRAETHGTFQIESRAQMNMLPQTLPETYYDLVVEVALVRPSPTEGGMVQPYLKGRALQRKGQLFTIGNKALEDILRRTCGVPIFQEQIMEISMDIAGFTAAEADQLRRSLLSVRSAESIDVMGRKLYQALISKDIPRTFADALFQYIKGYAHYGFPESHAASYASLAYKSAYMKCHYPAELLIGLINSQPMGFYSIDTLVNEAKRNGVVVLPIDPHISIWDATLEAHRTVRMGFRNVQGIRKKEVLQMLAERERQDFAGMEDFIFRTSFAKEVLENLALAGVFKNFGLDRRHSFWQSIEFGNLCRQKDASQLSLFDNKTRLESTADLFSDMSLLEEISVDYRKTGYSLQGNMMKGLRLECPELPEMNSLKIKEVPAGKTVRFAGIMTAFQRPPPAKGTAFITLEDEFGSIDTVFRNEIFEEYAQAIRSSRFLIVEGKVQRKGTRVSVRALNAIPFVAGNRKPNHNSASPRDLGRLLY